ncbi:hypothetical protein [Paraburkholderia saeva]|uniref:hypothetical protein n=1 Tax=Paraburkholderia saeva TaxID=2777537 RepID=UPI001DE2B49D|nr:hypothetical protein [Paraburkholderia saeva]CAG4913833.1 hypothetical protein R52603_04172 [Paraburkholderia saeva]
MISSQKSIVLAGLMIGVLALAVTVKPPGRDALSASLAGFDHDGASASGHVQMPAASARSGPVSADDTVDADIAQALQAVRYALQRNDLVSARQLLDAVHALHRGNAEVAALQSSLAFRESEAVRAATVSALPVTRAGGSAKKREPERTGSRMPASPGRSHEDAVSSREAATVMQRRTSLAGASRMKVGLASAPRIDMAPVTSTGDTPSHGASQTVSTVADVPQAMQSAEHTQTLPVQAQSAQPTQAASASPTPQTPTATTESASGGRKTRAQVRAELDRARIDGALPRFGNPDPKGPGGAPGTTVPQTVSAH